MKTSSLRKLGATVIAGTALTFALFTGTAQADGQKYTLNNRTSIYMNAYDARAERNSVGAYSAGEYYIYSEYNGYVNITKSENSPGAWVSKSAITSSSSSSTTTETPSNNSSDAVEVNGDTVRLTSSVNVYMNADNAIQGRNAVTTYPAGSYYVYRTYNGAVNISKSRGNAGGWVNANVTSSTTPSNNSGSNSSSTPTNSNTFNLSERTSVFMNAADAKSGNRAVGTYGSGTYYIYSRYNGMLNISSSKSAPGGWINPDNLGVASTGSSQSSSGSSASTSSNLGQKIVDQARSLIGYRYTWAGSSTSTGFDCSGLVKYVFRNAAGINLPHYAQSQGNYGYSVSRSNLKAGDLLFFGTSANNITHVGIYDGNGNIIHAANYDRGVTTDSINSNWYSSRLQFARRLVD